MVVCKEVHYGADPGHILPPHSAFPWEASTKHPKPSCLIFPSCVLITALSHPAECSQCHTNIQLGLTPCILKSGRGRSWRGLSHVQVTVPPLLHSALQDTGNRETFPAGGCKEMALGYSTQGLTPFCPPSADSE